MTTFNELLSRHIAMSMLKQKTLGEFLEQGGPHNWGVDMIEGTVDFGAGRVYPLQVIGTESKISNTWLWSWANEASDIAPKLLACAHRLRELGQEQNIGELTARELDSQQVDGHFLAVIASGVCEAPAYYRGDYGDGALFFLVENVPLQPNRSALELIGVMTNVISQFPVDHRIMAQSFLQQCGYTWQADAANAVATSPDGEEISLEFDAQNRLTSLQTTARPPVAEKKPWWKFGA